MCVGIPFSQLKRLSAKCNSNEAAEKKRAVEVRGSLSSYLCALRGSSSSSWLIQAMSKGNLDVARVHAQVLLLVGGILAFNCWRMCDRVVVIRTPFGKSLNR
jgi:hypothetical protein